MLFRCNDNCGEAHGEPPGLTCILVVPGPSGASLLRIWQRHTFNVQPNFLFNEFRGVKIVEDSR